MRLTAIVLGITLLATPALADNIQLFEYPTSGLCINTVTPFVPFNVYVMHTYSLGAKGSGWRIEKSESNVIALGSSCAGLGITGDPFTGVYLSYPSCLSGNFVICQLTFMSVVGTVIPGCYHLRVMPFPNEPSVTVVDCNDTPQAAAGGWFSFDGYSKAECDDCATPVESSTWGRVKSLYR